MTARSVRNRKAARRFKLHDMVLSGFMAAVLMEHANGPRRVRVDETETLKALRARRLIYFNRLVRPTFTLATTRGREIISRLLSMHELSATLELTALHGTSPKRDHHDLKRGHGAWKIDQIPVE